MERGWKPGVEISPNCPRCGSSNTKFCYYNNYSLTQPRYFCKGCRRYWTKGGSLRNVPVGGGCRKNRRSSSSSSANKSLIRLPITHGVIPSSKTTLSSYGGVVPTHHEANAESNSSSDGSHIDLALVYANFLNNNNNHQPENKLAAGSQVVVPSQSDHHQLDPSSLYFASLSNTNNNTMESSRQQLPAAEEDGLIGCPYFSEDNLLSNQIYYSFSVSGSGLESVHHQNHQDRVVQQYCTSNYGALLPPPLTIPGAGTDDLSSQQLLLSTSQFSINHAVLHQTTQDPPVLGPQTHDPNLLFGNWSPFDLPSDDTFTRT